MSVGENISYKLSNYCENYNINYEYELCSVDAFL